MSEEQLDQVGWLGDETPLVQREAAQGRRRTQKETRDASLTLRISLLEAHDLALGRGSPPVCSAHVV